MADLGPTGKRIAQLLRMLSSSSGERRNAFAALERTLQSANVSWTDIGDAVENGEGKYTENEMQEFAQAARTEGVEAGIKIGLARASNGGSNGSGNGHLTLPEAVEELLRHAAEMADCLRKYRNDLEPKHHEFIDKMPTRVRGRRPLSPKERGYLASLYIQLDGKV